MTDSFVAVAFHALTGLAVGAGLLGVYRSICRQSPLLGAIVAAGLLVQAGFGLLLFWISYLDLPLLQNLHYGNGFWAVAPDAGYYARRAATAVYRGLSVVRAIDPSPTYVRLLAVWMKLVGISPAAGMFLNLTLYGLVCGLVVRIWKPRGEWRQDLPCAALLVSVSFSPLMLFDATQILKDSMYVALIVTACVGVWLLLPAAIEGRRETMSFSRALFGLGLLMLALYLMAGIRAYFAFFLWASLALTLMVYCLPISAERLNWRFPSAIGILILTLASCIAGAGAHFDAMVVGVTRASAGTGRPTSWAEGTLKLIEWTRFGFVRTAGATNLVVEVPGQYAWEETDALAAFPPGPLGVGGRRPARNRPVTAASMRIPAPAAAAARAGIGLAAFFVPISLLQALSIVHFPGGRGLLLLTDLDTLFLDITLVVSFLFVYLRWASARRHLGYVCFLLLLACVSTLLFSYVIVNFGTLVRLRVMALVPVWMMVLAARDADDEGLM